MGLLNEIRLWNQKRLLNLYTIEIDENLNEIRPLTLLHFWICRTMNEIRLWNQIKLVNLYTFEIDENVKRDKTVEFVTLLNVWYCWMRYECEIDKKT